jgi:hypothetical protein
MVYQLMTVALLGIGADSTNTAPTPPVYPDGTFEYIPIPESNGQSGTVETRTYGNSHLRYQDATLADYLDSITPGGDGPTYTGKQLADWPLHHDPNFTALTYGETTSRGSYTKLLRTLSPGDIVAFYTGLRSDDATYRHRYIIGYFTVADIIDCQNIPREGQTVPFSDLPAEEQDSLMESHAENAHAKRFNASGDIADNDGVVIVDGTPPGGLLDKAVRISTHHGRGHHYLTDELQQAFDPEPGGNTDRNAYLGGIKKAHTLRIDPNRFRQIVE